MTWLTREILIWNIQVGMCARMTAIVFTALPGLLLFCHVIPRTIRFKRIQLLLFKFAVHDKLLRFFSTEYWFAKVSFDIVFRYFRILSCEILIDIFGISILKTLEWPQLDQHANIMSRVRGSLTNKKGFWIGRLDLLTSFFTVSKVSKVKLSLLQAMEAHRVARG
jgi:hypothetical protein